MVIYQNADFTGDSCLVNGSGVWASPNDELASSVDTTVSSGSFKLCRRPGDLSGGSVPIPVGSSAGSDPGDICLFQPSDNNTDPAPDFVTGFPDDNSTYWYSNDPNPATPSGKRLMRRGNLFRDDDASKTFPTPNRN